MRFPTIMLLATTFAAAELSAQAAPPPSVARVVTGAVLGGLAGAAAGGIAGGMIASGNCDSGGNPDTCLVHDLSGVLVGIAVGHTFGAPLGAHVAGRRRGSLAMNVLTSVAIGAAGLATVHASGVRLHRQVSSGQRNLIAAVTISVPVLQVVSSTVIERRTGRR